MAEAGDDPFGGTEFTGATEVPAAEPPTGDFGVPDAAPDASMEFMQEAVNGDVDPSLNDMGQMNAEQQQDAFLGGFEPSLAPPTDATPPAPAAPEADDPRVDWRRKNNEALMRRDKQEAEGKKAAEEKAAAHLKKFAADREKRLQSRKKSNRDAETKSPESGVPNGTTWQKVDGLINWKQEKAHVKDLSRFKSCLGTCKTLNVPVATR